MKSILVVLLATLFLGSTIAGYASTISRAAPLEIAFATLFFGILLLAAVLTLVLALDKACCRLSVRQIREGGRSAWVWRDLRGRRHRAATDPRTEWDAQDAKAGGRWGY